MTNSIQNYFDSLAPKRDYWKNKNRYYYNYIEKGLIPFLVPVAKKVLEIGSGTGALLVSLKPSLGWGTDISPEMVRVESHKYNKPEIKFTTTGPDNLNEKFDYLVISDVIGYVEDVEDLFRKLNHVTHNKSRVIITQYNQLWETVLAFGSRIGIRMKSPVQNWLSTDDIENLLYLAGFETIKRGNKFLL